VSITTFTNQSSVILIGGPDAGKSNFLFRLWMAIDTEKGALGKNGLPDEAAYLNTGAESLMKGKFAARTSKEVLEQASIPVKSTTAPTRTGILNIPDVPGEKILEIYRMRQWPAHWEEKVAAGCGSLLFVRAGSSEVVPSLDYAACIAALGAPLPAIPGIATAAQVTATNEPPTDIVLTDWLQFLRRAFTDRLGGEYRPRLGVVISAWDAVPGDFEERAPEDFLASEFPLTHQFLKSNDGRFDIQCFGISILSGDLTNDLAFRAQFERGNPCDFGYVIHSLSGTRQKVSDITIPVAWALGWLSGDTPKEHE